LNDPSGNLRLGIVQSTTNDVVLSAFGSILNGGDNVPANVSARNITLTSTLGGIGAATSFVTIDSSTSAPGVVNAHALSNIFLFETSGNLTVGTIQSSLGNATVYSAASILDSNDGGAADIIANSALLAAAGGIGQSSNPLETRVSKLAALALNENGVWIRNEGNMILGGVIPSFAVFSQGSVNISTTGSMEISQNVFARGTLALSTIDAAAAGQNMTIDTGVGILATGSAAFAAGDNFTMAEGSAISASRGVTIQGDAGDADAGVGSTIDIRGQIFTEGAAGVFGNADHDLISLRNAMQGRYQLNGRGGSDNYNVFFSGNGNDVVNVADSGEEGTDVLLAFGTTGADNILLRAGINSNEAFVANLHGTPTATAERINYNTNIEVLGVLGGDGDDSITMDDNRAVTIISGGAGNDKMQVGQLYASPRDTAHNVAPNDIFATQLTSRGYLSNGNSYSTQILGDAGDDQFTVLHNAAQLALNGGAGNDTFVVRAFVAPIGTAAGISANATTGPGIRYVQNAGVTVEGAADTDSLQILGTEFADRFNITGTNVSGAGLNVSYTPTLEILKVDMAEGNDTAIVSSTAAAPATTVSGGIGNDTFIVGSGQTQTSQTITGTQMLPAGFQGITALAGALTIEAEGGTGSLGGIPQPVMLPGETDGLVSQGRILSAQATKFGTVMMIIDTSQIGGADAQSLTGKTLDVATGPGAGHIYQILDATVGRTPQTLVLNLREASQPDPTWITPTAASTFAITAHSSAFFATAAGQDTLVLPGNTDSTPPPTRGPSLTFDPATGLLAKQMPLDSKPSSGTVKWDGTATEGWNPFTIYNAGAADKVKPGMPEFQRIISGK
ncbi:MAG: hypothetical protein ABI612_05635, partial [Betaproteobacteria bacterium]